MKQLLTLAAFVFTCLSNAQAPQPTLTLVGYLEKGVPHISVNNLDLIAEVNNGLYESKPVLNTVTIESNVTIGDRQELFYFLCYAAPDVKVVRYLYKQDNKLYLKNTDGADLEDFYVSCVGVDACYPRLNISGTDYNWGCSDKVGCSSPQDSEKNPCVKTTSMILPD